MSDKTDIFTDIFTAEGCNKAVRQAVLGDWKDPLNGDVEAQAIFIQLNQGKDRFR